MWEVGWICWAGLGVWGGDVREVGWSFYVMKNKEFQSSLFLTCLHWEKHPVKLCISDSYTYRNHLKYLYNIVCCVESVETKPPFPWVSCQSPKIAPRARTFPLWYFAFPCCTELGERKGNGLTPIMLHPDLSWPQFIASLYFLSHLFTCLNLGEKQGKRKERGGTGTSFQLGRQLPAFCVVSSSKVSWGISK